MNVYVVKMIGSVYNYQPEIMAICANQELADKTVERLSAVFEDANFDIEEYNLEEV